MDLEDCRTLSKTLSSTIAGKQLENDSTLSGSLWHAKAKYQDKEDIKPDQRRLTSAGPHLEDGRTFSDHNLQKGYTLHLVLRMYGNMQIFMKNSAGNTVPLDDETSDMNDTVKATALDKEGIPPENQCLFFVGRQLKDCSIISDYDIQREPTQTFVRTLASKTITLCMQIMVGKTFSLDIEASDILYIVEAPLRDKEDIPLMLRPGGTMLIFGKIMPGKTITIDVKDLSLYWRRGMQIFVKTMCRF